MKTLRLINTMGIAAMTLLMATSCESSDNDFGYDGETTVYFSNSGSDRILELGEDQEADLTDDNNHIVNIKAFVGGGYGNSNDVKVDYVIDPALCDGYNIDGAAIDVMPSNYYEVQNPNQFTIASGQQLGGVKVKLTDAFFEDAKSWESGYVIPVKLMKAEGVSKILSGKDMTFYRVKFVNPWTATYLRKGKDIINGAESHRYFQYVEKAEVIKVITKGLNKSQVSVAFKDAAGKAHNVNLILTFNGDDCTISSNTNGVEVTGSGKFVKKDQLLGEFKRNTLYLNYNVKSADLGTIETTDTMVVRNRGIEFKTFEPKK